MPQPARLDNSNSIRHRRSGCLFNEQENSEVTIITGVQPRPEEAHNMPYAPAVYVEAQAGFLFLAGCTASPLYRKHPHVPEEHVLPDDIREQTRRALANIKIILDSKGLTWRHVVKLTKYLTDMREMDAMYEVLVEHFGDWVPAGTLVCINNLSAPVARIALYIIAAAPSHLTTARGKWTQPPQHQPPRLPPRCRDCRHLHHS